MNTLSFQEHMILPPQLLVTQLKGSKGSSFVKLLANSIHSAPPPPTRDFTPIKRTSSLDSLVDRKHSINVSLLSNLLSSDIDSFGLLSRISELPLPPYSITVTVPFYIPFPSTNHCVNSLVIRLMRIANTDPTFSF